MNEIYLILFCAVGLSIGSFLNVCIYRIPIKESIVVGSSHCPKCNKQIKWYDLFPVTSYICLFGKCRNCKTKISMRYPSIELLNAVMYALVFLQFGLSLQSIMYCAMASVLIVVSMIDLDTGEIPNELVLALIIISSLGFISNDIPFWHRLVGFVSASGIILILDLMTNGFGGGDIKLLAGAGLILGYQLVLIALVFGIVIGGFFGVIVVIKNRKNPDRSRIMPFGPALSIGLMLSALHGHEIFNLWWGSVIGV